MEDDTSPNPTPILLGRPFWKTARTKVDVHDSTLTMEFDGETIRFNIFEAIRYPTELHSIFVVFFIDALAQQLFELTGKDGLEVVLSKYLKKEPSIRLKREVQVVAKVEEALEELECTPILSGKFVVSYLELPLSN